MVFHMKVLDAAADLLLQGACPGCGLPGKGVCPGCARAVMAGSVGPRERVGIELPLWSAGEYVHPVMRIISQAKDHHRWDAIALLGLRLAFAVAGLVDDLGLTGPGVLVPIPSRASSVRDRGLDFAQALAQEAARRMSAIGVDAAVRSTLAHLRAVKDQGDLSSGQRAKNLEGSLFSTKLPPGRWILLVDDVVTTGATLREGVRALSAAGFPPAGLATVAATVLRMRNH